MVTSINNSHTSELWQKVEAFQFDTPTTQRTFAQRIARDNAWTDAYTQRVIMEYKRFMFLLATTNEMLAPCDAVDQVWHMHLIYSKSYWLGFCQDILQKWIHHNPSEGKAQDADKYKTAYRRTKERYYEVFRVEPTSDIWYDDYTYAHLPQFIRVNPQTHGIVYSKMSGVFFWILYVGLFSVILYLSYEQYDGTTLFWMIVAYLALFPILFWASCESNLDDNTVQKIHEPQCSNCGGGCCG